MYSSSSFQTSVQTVTSDNIQFMESMSTRGIVVHQYHVLHCAGHLTDSASLELYSLLTADSLSVSTDSLSPRSHSSLSGDEEFYSGKRRRSYSSFPESPKRFRGGLYNIADELEVILPRSPESGIALSPPMTVYIQNPSCENVWIDILEQPEEVRKIFDHCLNM